MIQDHENVKYRMKLYHQRMPIFWWVHKLASVRFIARELTSVFVALYAVVLLINLGMLKQGPESYEHFLTLMKSPLSIALHFIGFLFVVFHSITWFILAPKALVMRIGNRPIPDVMIILMNYAAWIACTLLVAWIIIAR